MSPPYSAIGERFAMHAAKSWDDAAISFFIRLGIEHPMRRELYPAGVITSVATIDRVVPLLIKDGRIARGWLGVALQAVAVPDALRERADQSGGLMVMSVVDDGPAAQAGIVAGDIILSVDGTSTHRVRNIARHFGPDSIGRTADLRLIRGGTVITVQTSIAARPAA